MVAQFGMNHGLWSADCKYNILLLTTGQPHTGNILANDKQV